LLSHFKHFILSEGCVDWQDDAEHEVDDASLVATVYRTCQHLINDILQPSLPQSRTTASTSIPLLKFCIISHSPSFGMKINESDSSYKSLGSRDFVALVSLSTNV
jgi:hypothetical protein